MFSQDHTPEKLKDYQSFLQMHIAVSRAIQQKHDYINPVRFHFELNGGPGMHVQIDAKFEGTPAIAARRVLERKNPLYRVHFRTGPESVRRIVLSSRQSPA